MLWQVGGGGLQRVATWQRQGNGGDRRAQADHRLGQERLVQGDPGQRQAGGRHRVSVHHRLHVRPAVVVGLVEVQLGEGAQ